MTENLEQKEQHIPSKEEVMAFLTEQIEVKKLQAELQDLSTRLAKGRAEELQALNFIANMTNPKPPADAVPYKLTEEDLANNPELQEQGFSIGDEVLVPKETADSNAEDKKRSLKKN